MAKTSESTARNAKARVLRSLRPCVCGLLLMVAVLFKPTEAKAGDMYWSCDGTCATLVILALTVPVVLVSADAYYTVRAYERPISPQLGRNAIYWTSWQAGILEAAAIGSLCSGGSPSDRDLSVGMLALGAWPLSLTANGMWHAFPDSPATRGWAVGMVTFSDVALLSYDALLLGKGRRAGGGLAFAEAFIGTLQLGFGLVTVARADREDRAPVLSMTAIPAALTTYGILALALPKAKDPPSGGRAQAASTWAALPRLGFAPASGGIMMHAFGTF
jgi:hypothetical protein